MSSADHSKLMTAIGLSDSLDSSSDDIIPMQSRRKRQRSYSKRRNIRGSSPSSTIFFKSNYTYGLCALIKIILIAFVFAALTLSLALLYNLYHKLELLQTNIDGLQSAKSNLPEEMHIIHSHLKILDQNSTQIKAELGIALDLVANMTADIAQIQSKLQKITDSIEAAPTIAKLPKDVEDLKEIVADLGSKMTSDDKEVKLVRENQVAQDSRLLSFENRLKFVEGNISIIDNRTLSNSKWIETITSLKDDASHLAANITTIEQNLNSLLNESKRSQNKLDEWRLSIQDQISSINETKNAGKPFVPQTIPAHSVKKSIPDFVNATSNPKLSTM